MEYNPQKLQEEIEKFLGWKYVGTTNAGRIGYYNPSPGIDAPQEIIPDYIAALKSIKHGDLRDEWHR